METRENNVWNKNWIIICIHWPSGTVVWLHIGSKSTIYAQKQEKNMYIVQCNGSYVENQNGNLYNEQCTC